MFLGGIDCIHDKFINHCIVKQADNCMQEERHTMINSQSRMYTKTS